MSYLLGQPLAAGSRTATVNNGHHDPAFVSDLANSPLMSHFVCATNDLQRMKTANTCDCLNRLSGRFRRRGPQCLPPVWSADCAAMGRRNPPSRLPLRQEPRPNI
jgi:hypothetical protein